MQQTCPKKLYKYRNFNVKTLYLLSEAEIFYADPKYFNDPLDCKPTIENDLDLPELEKLFHLMHKNDYFNSIETINHYKAPPLGPEYEKKSEEALKRILIRDIQKKLYLELGSLGVLSLAERWDCPLMWSHYADSHQGICIEYNLDNHVCYDLAPINYERPRSIKASAIIKWKLENSHEMKKHIKDIFFFTKSRDWQYEKEWRDLSEKQGGNGMPFTISSIYFGLQCDKAVIKNIVRLYLNEQAPKFYEIYDTGIKLNRKTLDTSEIEQRGINISPRFAFGQRPK